MVLDFKNIDMSTRPQLILRNLDGVPFGTLSTAFNIKAEVKLNEVSVLSFDVPAYDNGEKTPFYDNIKSMTIIDLKDYGQFIVNAPVIKKDGIREIKSCTCYSLEFELTYKQFFTEKATYNFWNPVAPSGTILGMILETIPYWSVGTVDSKLIGKYRTFEASNINVFDFIKNTAQQTYNCVFTFDTYDRKINVIDASSLVPVSPVYLSMYNLIKEIEITENVENVVTCIEAYGADDVTIRGVNPLGTNKIYNLDYYMNETNLSSTIINKWNTWKELFENRQLPYYNLKIEEINQSARLLTEQATLTDLKFELKNLENQQSVSIQYLGEHPNNPTEQENLDQINSNISAKKTEISNQKSYISSIQSDIDDIKSSLEAINIELAFTSTFTNSELQSINKYIKEGSIQDSSFVISSVQNYSNVDVNSKYTNAEFNISNSSITNITNTKNKEIYSVIGGQLTCPCGTSQIHANIVRGSMERNTDGSFVFSCYLNNGTYSSTTFPSGNISSTGSCGSITQNSSSISFTASTARVYFTQNVTEYESRSVQFDLYDYAKQCLKGLSTPNYSFSVQPANFLALEDFSMFKNNFVLGNKVYLDIEDGNVLQPIVIGVNINFEDYTDFTIEFSNSFKTNDTDFQLIDLLEQSVSMGKTVDSSKYTYSSWVDSGASSSVKEFIESALDVTKNEILASVGQAISWDENGMRFRKWNDTHTDYDPEQIWMINNSIAMTDDNWNTVKTAIGKFTDENLGSCWGIIAPNLTGTILAGENLIIDSKKKDGGKSVFKVDASGAQLYNSIFDLYDGTNTQITLNPYSGIAIGSYPLYSGDEYTIDEDKATFWLDTNGFVHIKGDVYANNFYFNSGGNIKTLLSESQTQIPSDYLDLGNIQLDGVTGDITMSGSISLGGNITFENASSIIWGNNAPVKYQFSVDGSTNWHDTMQTTDKYRRDSLDGGTTWGSPYQFVGTDGADGSSANVPEYIKLQGIDFTNITGASVESPTLLGGVIKGADVYGGNFYDLNHVGRLNLASIDGEYSDISYTNVEGETEYEIFRVRDGYGAATLYLYDVPIVYTNGNGTASLSSYVNVSATFG